MHRTAPPCTTIYAPREQAGWDEYASCVAGRKLENSTKSGFYVVFVQTVENAKVVCRSGSSARNNVKVDKWDSIMRMDKEPGLGLHWVQARYEQRVCQIPECRMGR